MIESFAAFEICIWSWIYSDDRFLNEYGTRRPFGPWFATLSVFPFDFQFFETLKTTKFEGLSRFELSQELNGKNKNYLTEDFFQFNWFEDLQSSANPLSKSIQSRIWLKSFGYNWIITKILLGDFKTKKSSCFWCLWQFFMHLARDFGLFKGIQTSAITNLRFGIWTWISLA